MGYSVYHKHRTKKKSESLICVEPMTSRTSVGRLVPNEDIFTRFVVTRVQHTARISKVNLKAPCVMTRKERKKVNFKMECSICYNRGANSK